MDSNKYLKEEQGNNSENNKSKKRKVPIALLIVIDFLAAALLLLIFYVTNYEMHTKTNPLEALPTPSWFANEAAEVIPPESSPAPTEISIEAEPTPAPTIDPNDWRAKFRGKFTDGEIETTDNSYKSANINISIKEVKKGKVPYYIADIYVADLKYVKTAFAKDPNVMGDRALADKVAKQNEAIIAINGDQCVDNLGTVVRNGQLYRERKSSADVLVMNYDGSMEVFSPDTFDVDKIKSQGVYQVWTFGPMLLQDGQPMTKFNSTVTSSNPRTAVGYYEPGHYCFVVVGGRQRSYSLGCTMQELSQLMYDLGCTVAYNLDGGKSSEMIFMGEMVNQQKGRRSVTDILYIGDE